MGNGAATRTMNPQEDTLPAFEPTNFNAKLIDVQRRANGSAGKSKTNRRRPPLISYVQLSKLEKAALKDIALDEESNELETLIKDKYEKLYFEIGEWDSHETLIHCMVGYKKNKNLKTMLRLVLTTHPEHYEQLVNLPTSDGETPTIIAVMNSSIDCLNTLLNGGGIDLTLKDDRDQTAEAYATKEKESEMLELIQLHRNNCRTVNHTYVLNPTDISPELVKRQSVMRTNQGKTATDELLRDLLTVYPATFTVRDHEEEAAEIVKAGKFFSDIEFPAELKTLCDPKDAQANQVPFLQNIVWLRPFQIFNGKEYKLYQDHIAPEDVIQGKPKTCFYLAVFASLALHPELVRGIILNTEINPYGYYVVRLYVNGKLKDTVIDDQFPCTSSNRKAAFCQPNGSEMWVMLLEKAWIKNFGCYSKVQSILPEDIMEDVLGVPSYGFSVPHRAVAANSSPARKLSVVMTTTFNRIKDALTNGYLVVAVSSKEVAREGISPCQSYSVLQAVSISQTVHLLKLRNSIDSVEWNGDYGDAKITPELAQQLQYEAKRDGIFWATIEQFFDIFVYYSVGYYRADYHYSYAEFDQRDNSKENRNIYYRFNLSRRQQVNVRLIQFFSKYTQGKNYLQSPATITTLKIDRTGRPPKIIASGCPRSLVGHKSIHFDAGIFKDMEEGEYLVQVRVKWRQSTHLLKRQAVLGVYCQQPELKLERVSWQEGERQLLSAYYRGYTVYEYVFKQNRKIYAVESSNEQPVILNFREADFQNCQVDFGRVDNDQLKMRVEPRSVGTIQRKQPTKPMKAVLIS